MVAAVVYLDPGDTLAGVLASLWFFCEGCEFHHRVTVGAGGWTWNGSLEVPTITPSILCRTPGDPRTEVCHSFVRAGCIEYLADCTHPLAGRTVALTPMEGSYRPRGLG